MLGSRAAKSVSTCWHCWMGPSLLKAFNKGRKKAFYGNAMYHLPRSICAWGDQITETCLDLFDKTLESWFSCFRRAIWHEIATLLELLTSLEIWFLVLRPKFWLGLLMVIGWCPCQVTKSSSVCECVCIGEWDSNWKALWTFKDGRKPLHKYMLFTIYHVFEVTRKMKFDLTLTYFCVLYRCLLWPVAHSTPVEKKCTWTFLPHGLSTILTFCTDLPIFRPQMAHIHLLEQLWPRQWTCDLTWTSHESLDI